MSIRRVLKALSYLWPLPWTGLGLLIAFCPPWKERTICIRHGAIVCYGPAIDWMLRRIPIHGGAAAITLGHTILARDIECLEQCFTHEMVHVRQYVWWGPFFIPAYLLDSLWQWCNGRDPYLCNTFERQARTYAPECAEYPNSEKVGL